MEAKNEKDQVGIHHSREEKGVNDKENGQLAFAEIPRGTKS